MNDRTIALASAHRTVPLVQGDSSDSVQRARDDCRAFTDRPVPAPEPTTADSLVLVVSELTTSALRHGGGRRTLELLATEDSVTAAVSDPSPVPPRERAPDLGGGRGDSAGAWSATSPPS
ncbi:ATP-binding protein [Streptomyces sp. HB132]|uniref:ATP-binding protein n=1 Tax=Streptomyces sp. HB132 TaxID=767388 RepID=UPI001D734D64|nr:ATP-binding protein [Streptomyces sp. HB132]MBM7440277.1 two-component sensor histidine kinase [Streptomyces sp. HB132]